MFTVNVRDHIMIAHSLPGDMFGPAQQLHGATFVVDAAFTAETLSSDGVVVDIGLASTQLHDVLAEFNYRNLDEEPSLSTTNTTTEVLAREIADRLAARIVAGRLGPQVHNTVVGLDITLHESHIAWARYQRRL